MVCDQHLWAHDTTVLSPLQISTSELDCAQRVQTSTKASNLNHTVIIIIVMLQLLLKKVISRLHCSLITGPTNRKNRLTSDAVPCANTGSLFHYSRHCRTENLFHKNRINPLHFGRNLADTQIWIYPEIRIRISDQFWLRQSKFRTALGTGRGVFSPSALQLVIIIVITKCCSWYVQLTYFNYQCRAFNKTFTVNIRTIRNRHFLLPTLPP